MCDTYAIYKAARDILRSELRRYAKENDLVDREDNWFDYEADSLAEEIVTRYKFSVPPLTPNKINKFETY